MSFNNKVRSVFLISFVALMLAAMFPIGYAQAQSRIQHEYLIYADTPKGEKPSPCDSPYYYKYTNQSIINFSPESGPGDSGSLVVTDTDCAQPVGLYFAYAVNGRGEIIDSVASPIGSVLSYFGVSMAGGNACTASQTAIAQNQTPSHGLSPSIAQQLEQAGNVVNSAESQAEYDQWTAEGIPVSSMGPLVKNGTVVIQVGVAATVTQGIIDKLPTEMGGFPVEVDEIQYYHPG